MNNEQEKLNNGDMESELREVYQELKKNVKIAERKSIYLNILL